MNMRPEPVASFIPDVVFYSGRSRLEFVYENWHGITHTYIVRPQRIEYAPYDANGIARDGSCDWVLHAFVDSRSGEPRSGARRTFLLSKINHMRTVEL